LIVDALSDITVATLLGAGVLSLILESSLHPDDSNGSYLEGLGILLAVFVVVSVSAGQNWQKQKQYAQLRDAEAAAAPIRVVRAGVEVGIKIEEVVVGDVVLFDTGDVLPADGVLIDGREVTVDESHLTGESDDVDKNWNSEGGSRVVMYSGSRVATGFGRMMVTGVGERTQAGAVAKALLSLERGKDKDSDSKDSKDKKDKTAAVSRSAAAATSSSSMILNEETQLQQQLTSYATSIGQVGIAAAAFATIGAFLRFTIETFFLNATEWSWDYLETYLHIVTTGISVLVVAIPEGLPLAATLSLAYAARQLLEERNLVRNIGAAETMGCATVICSDKTGTLTQNDMAVAQLWLAGQQVDVDRSDSSGGSVYNSNKNGKGMELFIEGVEVNSTATVLKDKATGALLDSGSKTEIALKKFIRSIIEQQDSISGGGGGDGDSTNGGLDEVKILAQLPFNSERKKMVTAIEVNTADNNGEMTMVRVHVKGAAEIILNCCTTQLTRDGTIKPLDPQSIDELLAQFENRGQRALCLAYRESKQEEEKEEEEQSLPSSLSPVLPALEADLTLLAMVGIADPLRPEVPAAIIKCQSAGITVKMLTGDSAATAAAIARQCGILPLSDDRDNNTTIAAAGSIYSSSSSSSSAAAAAAVMEGPEFRRRVIQPDGSLNREEFLSIWPHLKVMARCSPSDKLAIVQGAQRFTDDVVAVTGDGTNDAPALRAAAVGFAMRSGTATARQAADIVLLDDNFASIVAAVRWGRNVYTSVTKFLQFQLTANIVAVVLAVVGSIFEAESPLTAVQMLWVNLIMDSLASLSLATEPPRNDLLKIKPFTKDYKFIDPSGPIFKHILSQAVWQLLICGTLLFYGPQLLPGLEEHIAGAGPSAHHTMVFNAFVCMQLFNQVNSRQIGDEASPWDGLGKAKLFLAVLSAEVVLQGVIVQWGGVGMGTVPLDEKQWGVCVAAGVSCLLVRQVVRKVKGMEEE